MEFDLNNLLKFFKNHKIILNKNKTEFAIFAKFRMNVGKEIQTIETTDSRIKETNQVKFLGVISDNILTIEIEVNNGHINWLQQ